MASQKTFLAAQKTPNLSASPDLNPKKYPRKRGMSSHHSSAPGTTTWLTPRDILEPLGKFDLDPCSAPDPNLWPTAETHYTAPKQDGLLLPWFGRIWLNPPYTNSGLMKWMSKMAHHNHGLALLFARVETEVISKLSGVRHQLSFFSRAVLTFITVMAQYQRRIVALHLHWSLMEKAMRNCCLMACCLEQLFPLTVSQCSMLFLDHPMILKMINHLFLRGEK